MPVSPEFEAALEVAGPAQRVFTLEIIRQKKDRLIVRRAANQRRRAELRALYRGIEEA
jgi:hypothetical protein